MKNQEVVGRRHIDEEAVGMERAEQKGTRGRRSVDRDWNRSVRCRKGGEDWAGALGGS
jgi:hypothetical protein